MGTKTITKYRNYSATQLKTRATIPDAADMTVSGNDVLCSNISTTKIRNGIGASVNTVGGLNTATSLNHWSGFGPTIYGVDTATPPNVTTAHPTGNYKMGDFAGYNHLAETPGFTSGAILTTGDVWIVAGSKPKFSMDVTIGEVRWENALSVYNVVHYIYDVDTSTLIGDATLAISGLQNRATFADTETDDVMNTETDVEHVAYFTNVSGTIICQIPNVTKQACTVKILGANDMVFMEAGGSWLKTGGGAAGNDVVSLDPDTATAYLAGIVYDGTPPAANCRVLAKLYDIRTDAQIGSTKTLFEGTYAVEELNAGVSGVFSGVTIPLPGLVSGATHDYGYRLRISIEWYT